MIFHTSSLAFLYLAVATELYRSVLSTSSILEDIFKESVDSATETLATIEEPISMHPFPPFLSLFDDRVSLFEDANLLLDDRTGLFGDSNNVLVEENNVLVDDLVEEIDGFLQDADKPVIIVKKRASLLVDEGESGQESSTRNSGESDTSSSPLEDPRNSVQLITPPKTPSLPEQPFFPPINSIWMPAMTPTIVQDALLMPCLDNFWDPFLHLSPDINPAMPVTAGQIPVPQDTSLPKEKPAVLPTPSSDEKSGKIKGTPHQIQAKKADKPYLRPSHFAAILNEYYAKSPVLSDKFKQEIMHKTGLNKRQIADWWFRRGKKGIKGSTSDSAADDNKV